MSEEQSFRKAAVGGFHRKDVIDYIEQLLIDQDAKQKELAEKDRQIAELQRQVAELQGRLDSMASDEPSPRADVTGEEDPEEVLKKVDRILKNYLGAEAEE